jgi:hypothetical protein
MPYYGYQNYSSMPYSPDGAASYHNEQAFIPCGQQSDGRMFDDECMTAAYDGGAMMAPTDQYVTTTSCSTVAFRTPARNHNEQRIYGGPVKMPATHAKNEGNILIVNSPGGTVVVPTNARSKGNIVIYNPPGGTVVLREEATNSYQRDDYDYVLQEEAQFRCSHCRSAFANEADHRQHRRNHPKFCTVHNMCFSSWSDHNRDHVHMHCGVRGCSKGNFGSDSRYMQHFRYKH